MNKNEQLKKVVSHNLESIKIEFERRARCTVSSICVPDGAAGVQISTDVEAESYAPLHFDCVSSIDRLEVGFRVSGFVEALSFDCVRHDWFDTPPFLND